AFSWSGGAHRAPRPFPTRRSSDLSALERLHLLPPADRTVDAALACLDEAERELRDHPDYVGLGLDDEQAAAFRDEAAALVRNYFRLEDPRSVRAIGLELMVEAEVDGV